MAGEEKEPVDDLIDVVPDTEVSNDPPPADDPPPQDDKTPAEKPAAKVDPPPPAEKPAKRDVPLATFLEEKRKFTEALQTERAEREKLRAELEALKNPPAPPKKFAEDPEGYIAESNKATAKEILAKLEETNKGIEAVKTKTEKDAERDAQTQFMDELGSLEDQFVQTQPDYPHALAHVRTIAYHQMKEFYPDATDQQLMQAITQQEIAMARQALAQGRNPHELAYRLAMVNGYKKADPPKDDKGKPAAKAAGITPDPVLDPDLTLGKSGGQAPGGAGDESPDPETYDPFDDALKEIFGRKRA
jgi:hypothetical protein